MPSLVGRAGRFYVKAVYKDAGAGFEHMTLRITELQADCSAAVAEHMDQQRVEDGQSPELVSLGQGVATWIRAKLRGAHQ